MAHNNYGVQLGDQRQWEAAIRELEEAIRLDDAAPAFRTNLANVHLNRAYDLQQAHDDDGALDAVNQAIAVNPDLASAYALKGDIEYDRQRLKEAKLAWEQAVRLDPGQHELAKRLTRVTEELPVESKFDRLSQAYFDLRYEEGVSRSTGFDFQEALYDARRTVGSDFAYWPKHRVVVLIYSEESFRRLREETPEWVAGQYDGKIRVPLPSRQMDPAIARQILRHEYTHALVHDLVGADCPTWLNEGLAEYEGYKGTAAPRQALLAAFRGQRLVPWGRFSDQFAPGMPVAEVRLGYEQAHSVVQYFVERYSFWRIRQLLKALGEGRTWEEACFETFRLKPARLETLWRDWLTGALPPDGQP